MSWTSLLPSSFDYLEIWTARLFYFLGVITIGPWFLLLAYDALLYIIRTSCYFIFQIGRILTFRSRIQPLDANDQTDRQIQNLNSSLSGETISEEVKSGRETYMHSSRLDEGSSIHNLPIKRK